MKKIYEKPQLICETLELEDVIASSSIGGSQAGDIDVDINDVFGDIWKK